jgi:hypothetical protein
MHFLQNKCGKRTGDVVLHLTAISTNRIIKFKNLIIHLDEVISYNCPLGSQTPVRAPKILFSAFLWSSDTVNR